MSWHQMTLKEILEDRYGAEVAGELIAKVNEVASQTEDPTLLKKEVREIFEKHPPTTKAEEVGMGIISRGVAFGVFVSDK